MGVPALASQFNGQGVVLADNYNTYIQTCDTVATLRQFASAVVNQEVDIQGYTARGDGGQGRFVWVLGTGTDDGGVTTVVPTGNSAGYWSRIPNYALAIVPQTVSDAGNHALSAANVTNMVLLRTSGTTPTDTFPSAGAIIGALPGFQIGSARSLLIVNESSGNLTISPGSGDTFLGNLSTGNFVIAAGVSRSFVIYIASASAVNVYG